jgi:hypothetical protein
MTSPSDSAEAADRTIRIAVTETMWKMLRPEGE